jgi:hypothetical protein
MTPHRTLAFVLLVALLLTAVTPARAEAVEATTILFIAGAAVVIVILVTYLVIANVRGERRAAVEPADAAPLVLVALHVPPAESP